MKNKANLVQGVFSLGICIYGIIRCYARPTILIIVAIILGLTSFIMSLHSWKKKTPLKSHKII